MPHWTSAANTRLGTVFLTLVLRWFFNIPDRGRSEGHSQKLVVYLFMGAIDEV
jgi:hypothetical protein